MDTALLWIVDVVVVVVGATGLEIEMSGRYNSHASIALLHRPGERR